MLRLENTKLVPLEPTVLPPSGKKNKQAPTQLAEQPTSAQKSSGGFFSKARSVLGVDISLAVSREL